MSTFEEFMIDRAVSQEQTGLKLRDQRLELLTILREWVTIEEEYGDPSNAAVNEIWLRAKTLLERIANV